MGEKRKNGIRKKGEWKNEMVLLENGVFKHILICRIKFGSREFGFSRKKLFIS